MMCVACNWRPSSQSDTAQFRITEPSRLGRTRRGAGADAVAEWLIWPWRRHSIREVDFHFWQTKRWREMRATFWVQSKTPTTTTLEKMNRYDTRPTKWFFANRFLWADIYIEKKEWGRRREKGSINHYWQTTKSQEVCLGNKTKVKIRALRKARPGFMVYVKFTEIQTCEQGKWFMCLGHIVLM